jgi:hypothetical protein
VSAWRGTLSLLLLAGAGCAHVDAKSETVAEHRNDAALHAQLGREERAQYDPSSPQRAAPRLPGTDPFGQPGVSVGVYNPSAEHLREADREFQEANEHLVAARSLIAFEHKACEGLSVGERSSCPLFAQTISLIELTPTGFHLEFQTQVDVDQTWRRLSCHLAYAEATGFDRPSCPLFIKGTTLARVGARGISFSGDEQGVTQALQAQARRLFLGLIAVNP